MRPSGVVVERWPRIFVWLHTLPFLVFVGVGGMIGTAQLTRPILGLVAFEIVVAGLGIWLAIRLVRAVRSEGWKNGLLHRPLAVEGLVILAICQLGHIIRLLPHRSAIIVGIFVGLMIALSLVGLITLYSVLTCISLFRSYRELFEDFNFGTYLWTSFYVSVLTVVITLLFSIPGAYAVARLRFRGRAAFSRSILLIYMVPMIVLALPIYIAFSTTGLRNTILGIVLIYPVTTIPVALYMLQGYFRGLPAEVEEAGLMDGLSRLAVIWKITLPLSLPALASVGGTLTIRGGPPTRPTRSVNRCSTARPRGSLTCTTTSCSPSWSSATLPI